MHDEIRSFVAMKINEELKDRFLEFQKVFSQTKMDVKWVERDNLHLTLKFLGNVSEEKIDTLKEALSKITQNTTSFDVDFSKVGCFPNINHPRVVWVGINNNDNLNRLVDEVENELFNIGFKKEEREFKSHITLGRIKSSKNLNLLSQEIKKCDNMNFGRMKVGKIYLMKSTLTPTGPIYTIIEKFNFKSFIGNNF